MLTGVFDLLTPQAAVQAVEQAFDLTLDGMVFPYPSYVNRVYGLRSDEGTELIAKFYRPERWTREAVEEEHRFVTECAAADIPVVAPLPDPDGDTVGELVVDDREREENFLFALYPKKGGRNFDAEEDDHWFRLGAIVGRCHLVGRKQPARHRLELSPELTFAYLDELLDEEVVHPDCRAELDELCRSTLQALRPLFEGTGFQRIHGDCHRGNILERPGEGLLLIDFDDMMNAPPVQDLWLLLPDHAAECRRELTMMLEGYEQFVPFARDTLILIEPLRFMRIVYFLTWRARQRHDHWFKREHPHWGSKAFWLAEIEDLRSQRQVMVDEGTLAQDRPSSR